MSILFYWFGLGDDSKSNDSNRLQSNNLGRQEETQPSLGLFNIPPSYIKYPEGMFDRRSFMQGVKLIEVAMDEFDSGNDANGLDIYLTGLDKILAALPDLKDIKSKEALRVRMSNIEKTLGIKDQYKQEQADTNKDTADQSNTTPLVHVFQQLIPACFSNTFQHKQSNRSMIKFKELNQTMIDIIIRCVVLFKKSPIPGLLSGLFSIVVHFMIWINYELGITEQAQKLGIECLRLLIKTEEQFHLHEVVAEVLYALFSVSTKAIIAYQETHL